MPNNMLSEQNYHRVVDETKPFAERQAAFNDRELWLNDLPIGPSTNYIEQINSMITGFGQLAVVLPKTEKGVTGFSNHHASRVNTSQSGKTAGCG
ncbi:hypothetical protein [Pseudoalteromonas maricaloris]|uniref:hypothetical protein n=1 Tax=Pseudoalteromonas maricaloris TaxID=184924 RepID=UPI0021AD9CF5|nr:hypothetical protein [Pseudoalteromonas flavipulchra]